MAPDSNATHIQYNAIEVEEHALTELDIETIVTEERRLDPGGITASPEQLA
jgi:hypothetical protein